MLLDITNYLSSKIYDAILPKAFNLPVVYDFFCCICMIVIVFSCYMIIINKRKYINSLYFSCMFYGVFRLMSVIFK